MQILSLALFICVQCLFVVWRNSPDLQIIWSNDEAVSRIRIAFVSSKVLFDGQTKEKDQPNWWLLQKCLSFSLPKCWTNWSWTNHAFCPFFFSLSLDLHAKSSGRCRQSFACALKKMPFFACNFFSSDTQWDAKRGTMDQGGRKSVHAVHSIKTITYTSTFGVSVRFTAFFARKKTRREKRTFGCLLFSLTSVIHNCSSQFFSSPASSCSLFLIWSTAMRRLWQII